MTTGCEVDHLVVVAATLEEGARWCEATLGIVPGPGGRHPLMGTHNRLFSIACAAFPRAYFEIIAIDPAAPRPTRARWFGLDTLRLVDGPRLVHFVARTAALDAQCAALRAVGLETGPAIAASRDTPEGRLAWRIAVRDDGCLLAAGALPTLIEWGPRHPTETMPDSGVALRGLALRGLPATAARVLQLRGVELAAGAGPALTATLDTPCGTIHITST